MKYHKDRDVFEVLSYNGDGFYKVWSENDQSVCLMRRSDLEHAAHSGDEVVESAQEVSHVV